jgi:protein SCO1/2
MRASSLKTAIAAALVSVAGLAVSYATTDGFQAYTLESARRLSALRSPAPIPDLALDVVDGGRMRFSDVPGRVLLVDFIYTRCPTYCAALGSVYAQLEHRLADEIASGAVQLLSISFDPARDGPKELRAYRARYSRDAAGWSLATPAVEGELRTWLRAFGVVVIPDELGGFAHNAAMHVVGPRRTLLAIHDLDDIEGTLRTIRETLGGSTVHVPARCSEFTQTRHPGARPGSRRTPLWIPDHLALVRGPE